MRNILLHTSLSLRRKGEKWKIGQIYSRGVTVRFWPLSAGHDRLLLAGFGLL